MVTLTSSSLKLPSLVNELHNGKTVDAASAQRDARRARHSLLEGSSRRLHNFPSM